MTILHPCIPIHRYLVKRTSFHKYIEERRKPLTKFQLWFIRKKLKWGIEEI